MNATPQALDTRGALRGTALNALLLCGTIIALSVAAYRQRGSYPLSLVTSRLVDRHIRNATLYARAPDARASNTQVPDTHGPNQRGAALVFNASDCPASLELIDSLNILAKSGMAVRGFMIGTPKKFPEWKRIPETFGMQFRVELLDPADAAALLAHFGRRVTPLVLELHPGETARAVAALNNNETPSFRKQTRLRVGLLRRN